MLYHMVYVQDKLLNFYGMKNDIFNDIIDKILELSKRSNTILLYMIFIIQKNKVNSKLIQS